MKGDPAHPGVGELVARAIRDAVTACGLPPGTFFPTCPVPRPNWARRWLPILVYAEMSSINPVILLPAALKARGAALAKAFAQSLTMGAGQFCTNPGLVIAVP